MSKREEFIKLGYLIGNAQVSDKLYAYRRRPWLFPYDKTWIWYLNREELEKEIKSGEIIEVTGP